MSAFETLNKINVNEHTEKKKTGGAMLTYLSWPWAWAEVQKAFPGAHYEIVKFDGLPYVYDPLTGYMVYTRVTIEDITHEMWLPVMDSANKAMKAEPYTYTVKGWNGKPDTTKTVEAATMFDVNKTIMRCLVKNLAMFGLGLYIYAGEDLPEGDPVREEQEQEKAKIEEVKAETVTPIMVKAMLDRMARIGEKGINVEKVCESYGVADLSDLTMEQYTDLNVKLNKEEERLKKAMKAG